MSRIRGADTSPELALRRALRKVGIGYRIHAKGLPGRPDVAFMKARLAVFVHGCFWHRHPGCRRATTPRSNNSFWVEKFAANTSRDRRSIQALHACGWDVGVIWECETEDVGDLALAVDEIRERLGR
jgi:DNA mismatch endonuclease (patch repair protein)